MEEVNRLCVPILVHQEDVKENAVSAQKRRDSLRELAGAPITWCVLACLVGTMGTLSEAISHLPLLPRPTHAKQIGGAGGNVQAVSKADDDGVCASPKSNMASEKRGDRMKMVELYQCPPFTAIPAPLPHDTTYATIVTRVVQAQRHLAHKPGLKASFRTILSSSTVEHFVIDSFWWFFLHNFQPDRKTQDRLFCRIAENYIRILTQNLSTHSGTAFLRKMVMMMEVMMMVMMEVMMVVMEVMMMVMMVVMMIDDDDDSDDDDDGGGGVNDDDDNDNDNDGDGGGDGDDDDGDYNDGDSVNDSDSDDGDDDDDDGGGDVNDDNNDNDGDSDDDGDDDDDGGGVNDDDDDDNDNDGDGDGDDDGDDDDSDLPSTLSQTLYCCFCCCFPQSCSFHDQAFLTTLCSTAYQWTGGICPAPDVYKEWDFEALEPDEAGGVSESEKRQKESGSTPTLSDSMFPNLPVNDKTGTRGGLKKPSGGQLYPECLESTRALRCLAVLRMIHHPPYLLRGGPVGVLTIEEQGNTVYRETDGLQSGPVHLQSVLYVAIFQKCLGDVSEASVVCSRDNLAIPGHASISEEDVIGSDLKALTDQAHRTSARESHAVYEGVELKQCVFNVWGNSPLVQHYMTTHCLRQTVGYDLLVRRSQIQKLPPYPFMLTPPHSCTLTSIGQDGVSRSVGTVVAFGLADEALTEN
ncbi:hypothetical protein NFI96_014717, partial [Prochilodus magdalenae]